MQLHPNDASRSSFYASSSLAAGFIGLDFGEDVGDLARLDKASLQPHHKDFMHIYDGMQVGDRVLIIAHHFPFAICRVAGEYNYIRHPVPELGVWFRHFRRVDDVQLFADHVTNAKSWEPVKMTDTISPLVNEGTKSKAILDEMFGET